MAHGVEERLRELEIQLPVLSPPSGSYEPAALAGRLLFTAGQVPRVNGEVRYKGKAGGGVTMEDAYAGARLCAINCLAAIKQAVGSLEKVERIVKVNGYINAVPGFTQNPKVLNGASDLLIAVFGEAGRHARSAIGVEALPDQAVVEIEMVVLLKEGE